jgi:hypothetical protein
MHNSVYEYIEIKWTFPIWADNAYTKRKTKKKKKKELRPPNKSPNTRHEKPSLEGFVVRGCPRDSQNISAIPLAIPPEREGT